MSSDPTLTSPVPARPLPTGPVAAGPMPSDPGPIGGVRIVAPLGVEALAVGGTRIGLRACRPLPPGPLLLAGVAGAVTSSLRPGDLLVADRLLLPPPAPSTPARRANVIDDHVRAPARAGRPSVRRVGTTPRAKAIDDHVCARAVGAAELAERLRAAGLTVHVGAIGGVDRIVTGADRTAWAERGALAVDMESAVLARTGRLVAVVRAIVDTPVHPLVSLGTLPRGIAALRALRRAAPVLSAWAAGRGGPDVRKRQAGRTEAPATLPGEVENS